jgi:GNAT superfamily N-acetyltransferase
MPTLRLSFYDGITEGQYPIMPEKVDCARILEFAKGVPPERIIIHCLAGRSRSPAAALLILAQHHGREHFSQVVQAFYRQYPAAVPNDRMLELGSALLGWDIRAQAGNRPFMRTVTHEELDAIIARQAQGWGIKYYLPTEARHEATTLFLIPQSQRIVAMMGLQQNPADAKETWLKYISVDPDYQQQGLGIQLLRQACACTQAAGQSLELSSWTQPGRSYLAPKLAELRQEFPGLAIRESPSQSCSPAQT